MLHSFNLFKKFLKYENDVIDSMEKLKIELNIKFKNLSTKTEVIRNIFIKKLRHFGEKVQPYLVVAGSQGSIGHSLPLFWESINSFDPASIEIFGE